MGDVVGKPGLTAVRTLLPKLIGRHSIDLVIANAENSEGGAGISGETAEHLLQSEVNLLTSGNHFWTKKQILPWVQESHLVDLALGGALVALREQYPYPNEKGQEFDERAAATVRRGMAAALDRGLGELRGELQAWEKLVTAGRERLNGVAAATAKPRPRRKKS